MESKVESKVKILNALAENPHITIPELSVKIGLSIAGIEKDIRQLRENGQIRHVGSTKSGYWEVIRNS